MIQDVLRSIGGVGIYGIVSISLFFTVFCGMLIWAARLKRAHLDRMSALPLEDRPATGENCHE